MPRTGFSSSTARRLADGATAGSTTFTGQIGLAGAGLASLRLRPELDYDTIRGNNGIPDGVTQGLYHGFSLPIYEADSHEELFFGQSVPRRWDGVSDITAVVHAALDSACSGMNFKLQLAWEHFAEGGVVPASENLVTCEKATGVADEYQTFICNFTIDYDIDGAPNEIKADELLTARLRRVAATEPEAAGEIIIYNWDVQYRIDKLGAAA